MPTDPFGNRYPDSTYAVDVPQDIKNAVDDLGPKGIPNFTSTSERDTKYTSWVANGGAMRNGLHCWVGTTRYVYLSGAWVVDPVGYVQKMMLARRETNTAGFPNDTWTGFADNTNWTENDPWGMHSTGSALTAVWTGWYNVAFTVYFNNNSTGQRGIRLLPSAGQDIGEGAGQAVNLGIVNAAGGSIETALTVPWQCPLTAGATVTGQAYQNSGGTLQINYVGITATYLGPNT